MRARKRLSAGLVIALIAAPLVATSGVASADPTFSITPFDSLSFPVGDLTIEGSNYDATDTAISVTIDENSFCDITDFGGFSDQEWSCDGNVHLNPGDHEITAIETLGDGSTHEATSNVTVTVPAPGISNPPGQRNAHSDSPLTFGGTVPFATGHIEVSMYKGESSVALDNTCADTPVIDDSNNWTCSIDTYSLAVGTYHVKAIWYVDDKHSDAAEFTLNIVGVFTSPSAGDLLTSKDQGVTGYLAPNSPVTVTSTDSSTGTWWSNCTTTTDSEGYFDCVVSLLGATQSVTFEATDDQDHSATLIAKALVAPHIDDAEANVLHSTSPNVTISGTAWLSTDSSDPATLVTCRLYSDEHQLLDTFTATTETTGNLAGTFTCPFYALANDAYGFTVTQHPFWAESDGEDAYSDEQENLTLWVDHTADAQEAPVITSVEVSPDNPSTVVVTGTSNSTDHVGVYDSSSTTDDTNPQNALCKTGPDGNDWACEIDNVASGAHSYVARSWREHSGYLETASVSPRSGSVGITLFVPTITTPGDNSSVDVAPLVITGAGAGVGGSVSVYIGSDSSPACTDSSPTGGAWSCTIPDPLEIGEHSLHAEYTGNDGSGRGQTISITTRIAPITVTPPTQGGTNFKVISGNDLTIDGTGSQSGAIEVKIGDTTVGDCESITPDSSGHWSCTITSLVLESYAGALSTGFTVLQHASSEETSDKSYSFSVLTDVVSSQAQLTNALNNPDYSIISLGASFAVSSPITIPRDVTLDLKTFDLTTAGISIANGKTFTITSTGAGGALLTDAESGSLTATATGSESAGILTSHASLVIANGHVTATGAGTAAGIGGRSTGGASNTADVGNGHVTITGGVVDATGGYTSAGIGGGFAPGGGGNGGIIDISGGHVTAHGRGYGAGIGGSGYAGQFGTLGGAGTITISGGTVHAYGDPATGSSYSGAGIGGGFQGSAGSVTISGGTVTAVGGSHSAGIGSGSGAILSSTVAIGGSATVTATGGDQGAGIGGGTGGDGATVTISDSADVTANGGDRGAGIGGGYQGDGGTTTINGGTVTASGTKAYGAGAGIGGGYQGAGGTTTINNGVVTATGGDAAAGIGGGSFGPGGTVDVEGGAVTVIGGATAPGIGSGGSSAIGNAGSLTIGASGTVTAINGSTSTAFGAGNGAASSQGVLDISGKLIIPAGSRLIVPNLVGTTVETSGIIDGDDSGFGTILGTGTIANHGSITLPTANIDSQTVITDHNYTIDFYGNADDATPAHTTIKLYAATFDAGKRAPPTVTRPAYLFTFWFGSDENSYSSDQAITGDMEYDAHWNPKEFSVSFSATSPISAGNYVTASVNAPDENGDTQDYSNLFSYFLDGVQQDGPVLPFFTTPGDHTVTAKLITDDSVTASADFSIVPGAPDHLSVPSELSIPAGNQTIPIIVADRYGNTVTNHEFLPDITLTVTTGIDDSVDVSNLCSGVDCSIEDAGVYTIHASAEGLDDVISHLTVTPGPFDHIYAPAEDSAVAGTVYLPIEARDAYGNTVTDGVPDISVTITHDVNGDTVEVPCDGIDCTITEADTYTVVAHAEGSEDTTTSLTVTAGSFDHLSVPTEVHFSPGSFSYPVEGRDQYENPITNTDELPGVTLQVTQTVSGETVYIDAGCEGTHCELTAAGTYDVTTSATGFPSVSGTLIIDPSTLDHFTIARTDSSPVVAGTTVGFTATGYDQYNNVVAAPGDITLSYVDLNGDTVSCSGLSCAAGKLGTYTVTATSDSDNSDAENPTTTFSVDTAAAADHLLLPTSLPSATAGDPVTIPITAKDAYGNAATVPTDATLNLTDPHGDAVSNGCDATGCTGTIIGQYTVKAHSEQDDPAAEDPSKTFYVAIAAGFDHFTIAPNSTNVVAGTPVSFTVHGLDAYGNGTDAPDDVSYTLTDAEGHEVANACIYGACTATLLGTYTVTAHSTQDDSDAEDPTTTFIVSQPDVLDHFTIVPSATPITAGATVTFTIDSALDQYGNDAVAPDDVQLSASDSTDDVANCDGLSCTFSRIGTYTVTATSEQDYYYATDPSTTVVVDTAAGLDHFTIAPLDTASVVAGANVTFTAAGIDRFGNDAPAPDDIVLTVNDAQGDPVADACEGMTCHVGLFGTYTVTASSNQDDSDAADPTATFTVDVAGPLDHFTITPGFTSTSPLIPVAFTPLGWDEFNNPRTAPDDVSLVVTKDGTPVDSVCEGLTCTLGPVGTYLVTATSGQDPSGATDPTATIVITGSGALHHFTITPSKSEVTAGETVTFNVEGFDVSNNPATAPDDVTLTVKNSNGDSIDGGCEALTCTVGPLDSYTVTATSSQDGDGVTDPTTNFTVNAATVLDHFTISPSLTEAQAGTTVTVIPKGFDRFNNPTTDPTDVTLTLTDSENQTVANGCDDLTLTCVGGLIGGYTITASSNQDNSDADNPTANFSVTEAAAFDHFVLTPDTSSTGSGEPVAITADGFDAYGNPTNAPDDVVLTVTDSAHNVVDNVCSSDLVCTLGLIGSYTITGSSNEDNPAAANPTTTISVTEAGGLDHFTVTPDKTTVAAGKPVTFAVDGFDAAGNATTDPDDVFLTLRDSSAHVVDDVCEGLTCAVGPLGTYTVTATSGEDNGSAADPTTQFTVDQAGILDYFTVTPATSSAVAGAPVTFTPHGFDRYDNPTTDPTDVVLTAKDVDDQVVADACTDLICSFGPLGTYTVTASSDSDNSDAVNPTAAVTIAVAAGLDHFTISPSDTASVTAGSTVTFTPHGFDKFENPTAAPNDVILSVVNSSNQELLGACTGLSCTVGAFGTYTVTAGSLLDDKDATDPTATFTVDVAAGLDHFTIVPSATSVTAGNDVTITPSGFDRFNNPTTSPDDIALVVRDSQDAIVDDACIGLNCTITDDGDYTVTASSTQDSSDAADPTAVFTVTAAGLDHFTINTTAVSPVAAGTTIHFTTQGFDPFENLVPAPADAHFAVTTGGAPVGGACEGADCSITSAGTYLVTATSELDSVDAASPTKSLTVVAAAIDHFTLTRTSASSAAAGSTVAFAAHGFDFWGNTTPAPTDVTLTATDTTTHAIITGACTDLTCMLTAKGTYDITAASAQATFDADDPALSVTIVAAPLDHFTITTSAVSPVTAGNSITFVSHGFDLYNNATTAPADVLLSLKNTTTNTTTNVCTGLVCTPTTVGDYTVTATSGLDSPTAADPTADFAVTAAALDHFTISTTTPTATAGTPITFTATGFDTHGNPTAAPTNITLTAKNTATNATTSCPNLTCTLDTAGSYLINATSTQADFDGTPATNVTITAGALDHFTISTTSASTVTAGATVTYVAHGFDAHGNTTTDPTDVALTLTNTTTNTVVPCTGLSCTVTTSGNYSLTASSTQDSPSATEPTATFAVEAAPLDHFTISTTENSPVTAGTPMTFTAYGFDVYDNSTSAPTDVAVTLKNTTTNTTANVCTGLVCTPTQVGAYVLTATSGSDSPTAIDPSATFSVTATGLDHFTFVTGSAAPFTAGATISFFTAGFDRYGNDTTAPTDVVLTDRDSTNSVIAGACTNLTCTLTVAGLNTITATSAQDDPEATDPIMSTTVKAAALDHFTISTSAVSPVVAGTPITFVPHGWDLYNNPVTAPSDVALTLTNTTTNTTAAVCADLVCTPTAVGAYTLTATSASDSVTAADPTATFSVKAAGLDHFTVTTNAVSPVTAGTSITFAAHGLDFWGNPTTTPDDVVITLTNTTTNTTSDVCTGLDCTPTEAGAYTLTAVSGLDSSSAADPTASFSVAASSLEHFTISTTSPSSIAAGTAITYVAHGFDSYGNATTDPTDVTLSATNTTTNITTSCSGLVCTLTAVGSYVITASSGQDDSDAANPTADLTVTAAALDHFTITRSSAASIAADKSSTFAAHGFDLYDNPTTAPTDVALTATDTTTHATVSGCSGLDCAITTVGTYAITAASAQASFVANVPATTVTVTAGPFDHFTITTSTVSPVTAGNSITFVAHGFDLYNNATTAPADVLLSLKNTTTNTTVNVCTGLVCTPTNVGNYTVTATSGLDSPTAADPTADFSVTAAALDHFTISTTTPSVTAGTPVTFTATGFDSHDNPTATPTNVTLTTKNTTTNATTTCTGLDCTLDTVGSYLITATSTQADFDGTPATNVTITAGPLDHFTIGTATSSVAAGSPVTFTAHGFDSHGNATTAPTNLTLTAKNTTTNVTTTCSGLACTITDAGTYLITATSTEASFDGTVPTNVTVTSAPLDHFTISTTESTVAAGTPIAFKTHGFDIHGNGTAAPTNLTLTAKNTTTNVTTTCSGLDCTLDDAGSYLVTGTSTQATFDGTVPTTITVTASALDHFTIATSAPASVAAGTPITFTASGFDSHGNPTTAPTNVILTAKNDTTHATVSCDGLDCTIDEVGSYTITAASTQATFDGTVPITVTVVAAAIDHFTLTRTSASSAAAGSTVAFAAHGFDFWGNTTPAPTDVALTAIDTTTHAIVTGACTDLTCVLTAKGTYEITAASAQATFDADDPALSVTITAAGLDHLTITTSASSPVTAGNSISFVTHGFDLYNNPTTAPADVLLTLKNTTTNTTVNVCTGLVCTPTAVGNYTVTATSGLDSPTAADPTLDFTVTAAALDHFTISTTTPTATAGTPVTFTATGFDSHGNPTAAPTNITLTAKNTGTNATTTCTALDCTLDTAGSYLITATSTQADFDGTPATNVTITAGTLDHFTIGTATSSVAAGSPVTFTAHGFDSHGNAITAPTNVVLTAKNTTTNVTTTCSGLDCTITDAGAHLITATSTQASFDGAVATTVTVNAAALDHFTITTATVSPVTAGTAIDFVAHGFDSYGNGTSAPTNVTLVATNTTTNATTGCTSLACTIDTVGTYLITGTSSQVTFDGTIAANVTVTAAALDHFTIITTTTSATAGSPITLVAHGFDSHGNPTTDPTNVTLTAKNTTTNAVTSCTGLSCTIDGVGTYLITAASTQATFDETTPTNVTITAGTLDHFTLTTNSPATVTAGATVAYAAHGFDAHGNPTIDPTDVALTLTNTTTDTVMPCSGLSCHVTIAGAYTLTATSAQDATGATEPTASFAVKAAGLDHFTLTADAASPINAGTSSHYTAHGFDSFGNGRAAPDDVTLTATDSNNLVVDSELNGSCANLACTLTKAGTYTITGSSTQDDSDAANPTIALTIASAALSDFHLSSQNVTSVAGTSPGITVTAVDSYGNPVGSSTLTFAAQSDVDSSNACVSDFPCAAGTYVVTATNGNQTRSGVLHVTAAALTTLSLSPTSASIVSGGSRPYSVTSTDRFGNTVSGTTLSITPQTDFAGDATCDAFTCTATIAGVYTVTARNGEHTPVTASLTVTTPATPAIVIETGTTAGTTIDVTVGETSKIAGTITGDQISGMLMKASMTADNLGTFDWTCEGPDDAGKWDCALPAGSYPPGTYTLTVSAVRGSEVIARNSSLIVIVADAPVTTSSPTPTPTETPTETPTPSPTPTPTHTPRSWTFTIDGGFNGAIKAGSEIVLHASGMPEGTTGDVVLHSDPVFLGSTSVGADGEFLLRAKIPSDIEPGEHHIIITVTTPGDDPSVSDTLVIIDAPDPIAPTTPVTPIIPVPGVSTGGTAIVAAAFIPVVPERMQPGAVTALTKSVPTVLEIVASPVSLAIASGLALAIMLLIALPTELLNSTLEANSGRFGRRMNKLEDLVNGAVEKVNRKTGSPVWAALILAFVTSVIFGFVDPDFGFDLASARLVLSMGIAFFIVSFGASALSGKIMGRAWKVESSIEMQPFALIFAIIGVVVARSLGFSPGFLVGLVVGLEIAHQASHSQKIKATVVQITTIVVFAIVAWLGYSLITAIQGDSEMTFFSGLTQDALTAIISEGLTAAFVGLLPLAFFEGKELFELSKKWWVILYLGTGIPFVLLVLPSAASGQSVGDLVVWTLVLVVFSGLTFILWGVVRWRHARAAARAPQHGHEPEHEHASAE